MLPEDKFCPGCGSLLERPETSGKPRPVCANCRRVIYYDPKVAAVVVVARDSRVLMVRRANQPGYGLWSVPGGSVCFWLFFVLAPCRAFHNRLDILPP